MAITQCWGCGGRHLNNRMYNTIQFLKHCLYTCVYMYMQSCLKTCSNVNSDNSLIVKFWGIYIPFCSFEYCLNCSTINLYHFSSKTLKFKSIKCNSTIPYMCRTLPCTEKFQIPCFMGASQSPVNEKRTYLIISVSQMRNQGKWFTWGPHAQLMTLQTRVQP